MRYKPTQEPEQKDKSTQELHADLEAITSNGFEGLTALNGVVSGVVGDLSDNDIGAVEDYLGVSLTEVDR